MWRPSIEVLTRYAPSRRLALLTAATAPLWLLPGAAGVYAGTGMAVLLVLAAAVDFLLLPPRACIRVDREAPPAVGIGDTVPGHYTLANSGARGLWFELRDDMPTLVRGGVAHMRGHVIANGVRELPFELTGTARGEGKLGPVGIRTGTRAGLIVARYRIELDDLIRVVPSVTGIRRYRLLAMQNRLDAVGVRVLRRKGEGHAFASLREYVRGDDPRHIDWKATSKRAKLITREFTIERSQTVITMIDAGRGMTQRSGAYARFEHALSAALILTDIAASSGDRVGTLVFDDDVRAFVPPLSGRAALHAVRDALVPVVATSAEPDYASAFRFFAAHQRKRALVVFFTDVIDVRSSQALLAHVTHSAARHLVLVVALRNDALFEAAHPRSEGSSALLYENAAAEEVIQAREAVLERMRRAGVVVLDVSPMAMTAGVVNRYLELKSRGAL